MRKTKKFGRLRLLRRKEVFNNLSAGSHICILQNGVDDPLVRDILSEFSVRFIRSAEPISQFDIMRSEFNVFLKKHGTVFGIFSLDLADTHVICTVGNLNISPIEIPNNIPKHKGGFVGGFTKKAGKGLLTVIPFFLSRSDSILPVFDGQVFTKLQSALQTHKINIVSQPPKWIETVNLKTETDILNEMAKLNNELQNQQILLDIQSKIKSVLWLKHNELRDACINLLQEMGIKSLKEDIGEEDFWILGDNNDKVAIVECKGKDGDLRREDITEFEHHRVARGKGYGFPSLLIVNSHNKAETLAEKDSRIPSNVIEIAVRLEILIIRTIDLVHLIDLIQRGILTRENFLDRAKSEKGWMIIKYAIDIVTK